MNQNKNVKNKEVGMTYKQWARKFNACLILIFLLIASAQHSSAQSPELPQIISSSSPTAAGLSRYIDFPVSLNNGIPDISIPIYTLTSSRLKVPITLSYHAGGIKVMDRTSTMGLGWTLSAGGVINRVMHGLPDELTNLSTVENGGWLHTVWPSDVVGNGTSLISNNADEICVANHLYNTYIQDHAVTYLWDGQPDTYFFSAPGLSGKFLYRNSPDPNGQRAVTIPYQPIKISNDGTTITGSDGVVYEFNGGKDYYTSDRTTLSPYDAPTAWYLSKMTSADGSDVVTFSYSFGNPFEISKIPKSIHTHYGQLDHESASRGGLGDIATVSTGADQVTSIENCAVLLEITSKNTDIVFNYSNSGNLTPLESIDVYSILNGVKTKIKTITFGISQFSGGGANSLRLDAVTETGYEKGVAISNPPYQIGYTSDDAPPYNSYAQDLWGYYNGQNSNTDLTMVNATDGTPVQFAPQKRTPNAATMMKGMIKSLTYPTGGKSTFTFEPNQIVTTNTISVPTNTSVYAGTINGMDVATGTITAAGDLTFTLPAAPTGTTVQSYTFNFSGQVNYGCSGSNCVTNTPQVILINETTGDLVFNQVLSQLQSGAQTTDTYTNTFDLFSNIALEINPGDSYRLYFYNPPTLTGSQSYKYWLSASLVQNLSGTPQSVTQTETVLGGGLRIKQIAHTDPVSGNTLLKTYNYTKPYFTCPKVFNGDYTLFYYTLLAKPKWWFSNIRTAPTDPFTQFTSSVYILESTPVPVGGGGSSIAYQEVEEMQTNVADGTTLGKTVYTFNAATDYVPLRVPSLRFDQDEVRKQLLDTKVYKNGSDGMVLLKETTNTYNNVNNGVPEEPGGDNIKLFVASSDFDFTYNRSSIIPANGVWSAAGCSAFEWDIPFTLQALYYNVSRNFLTSTTVTDYDGPTPLTTTTNYTYGNYAHMQPTQITTTNSKSQLKTETMLYPLDFSNITSSNADALGIINLQNLHLITPPIEKSSYLKNASNVQELTSSVFTTYHPSLPVPAKISVIESASPLTDFVPAAVVSGDITKDSRYQPRLNFGYDVTTGNTLEQQKSYDAKQAYVWDYNNNYPIAKAVNASVADIAYTSFEADGKGNWSFTGTPAPDATAPTGTSVYTFGAGISKSGLTATTTYIVSYWSRNGSYSISGTASGYPKAGKHTSDGWTYYEHKVTGQTAIAITGTGAIDELRLYPVDAQMTSYTYSPLVGITSQADASSRITYYEYDGLQRLKHIRDQDRNILKSFDYQYQGVSGCTGNCYILGMQTLNGTATIGYPVGVFSVAGKLLGNATTQADYITSWNRDSADAAIGTLAAGADPLHFQFTLNPGKTLPVGVTGCRYYQVDVACVTFDAVRNMNGAYVDFGDGTGMRLGATDTSAYGVVLAPYTTQNSFGSIYSPYFVHTYPSASLKTLTFYHNDARENAAFDNYNNPATSLTLISNLRGNLPQQTTVIGGSSYQQASMSSVANITNWNSIHSVRSFYLNNGDGGPGLVENLAYAQDFMKNNTNLDSIRTYWGTPAYYDPTFKLSRLKSDWNTYFRHISYMVIGNDQWDQEDLSGLKELAGFFVEATRQDHSNNPASPYVPITPEEADNILLQIASGAGQFISNGDIKIITRSSSPTQRTSASDAAVSFLLSKGWTVLVTTTW